MMSLTIAKKMEKEIYIIGLLVLFLGLFSFSQKAIAEYRIALIIGNGEYVEAPLVNPPLDARLMMDTLSIVGFDIMSAINAEHFIMEELIYEFLKVLESNRDSVGLFYYSGHGIQIDGRNYLIPVKVSIEDESDVLTNGIDVEYVLRRMHYAGNRMNLIILDASRNSPFESIFKSPSKGLGIINAPLGTVIASAAQPNSVAVDYNRVDYQNEVNWGGMNF